MICAIVAYHVKWIQSQQGYRRRGQHGLASAPGAGQQCGCKGRACRGRRRACGAAVQRRGSLFGAAGRAGRAPPRAPAAPRRQTVDGVAAGGQRPLGAGRRESRAPVVRGRRATGRRSSGGRGARQRGGRGRRGGAGPRHGRRCRCAARAALGAQLRSRRQGRQPALRLRARRGRLQECRRRAQARVRGRAAAVPAAAARVAAIGLHGRDLPPDLLHARLTDRAAPPSPYALCSSESAVHSACRPHRWQERWNHMRLVLH